MQTENFTIIMQDDSDGELESLEGNRLENVLVALKAKERGSILWLLAKACNDNIPSDLREPYYKDHDGQDRLKPTIVKSLANAEFYCDCLANIYQDPHYNTLSHNGIIRVLTTKGIYVQEPQDFSLTESVLLQTAPIRMNGHMVIIEALMSLYIKEVLIPEKVAEVVHRFCPLDPDEELPDEAEDAAIFWINKACIKLREQIEEELAQMTPTDREEPCPTFPTIEYLWDLGDGIAIASLLCLYCPDEINWRQIAIHPNMTTPDSIYNLQLVQMFCHEKFPSGIFHLAVEDFFDCHRVIRPNVLGFMADLMYYLEIQPLDCVRAPSMEPILTSDDDLGHVSNKFSSPSELKALSLQHTPTVSNGRRGSYQDRVRARSPVDSRASYRRSMSQDQSHSNDEELSRYFSTMDINPNLETNPEILMTKDGMVSMGSTQSRNRRRSSLSSQQSNLLSDRLQPHPPSSSTSSSPSQTVREEGAGGDGDISPSKSMRSVTSANQSHLQDYFSQMTGNGVSPQGVGRDASSPAEAKGMTYNKYGTPMGNSSSRRSSENAFRGPRVHQQHPSGNAYGASSSGSSALTNGSVSSASAMMDRSGGDHTPMRHLGQGRNGGEREALSRSNSSTTSFANLRMSKSRDFAKSHLQLGAGNGAPPSPGMMHVNGRLNHPLSKTQSFTASTGTNSATFRSRDSLSSSSPSNTPYQRTLSPSRAYQQRMHWQSNDSTSIKKCLNRSDQQDGGDRRFSNGSSSNLRMMPHDIMRDRAQGHHPSDGNHPMDSFILHPNSSARSEEEHMMMYSPRGMTPSGHNASQYSNNSRMSHHNQSYPQNHHPHPHHDYLDEGDEENDEPLEEPSQIQSIRQLLEEKKKRAEYDRMSQEETQVRSRKERTNEAMNRLSPSHSMSSLTPSHQGRHQPQYQQQQQQQPHHLRNQPMAFYQNSSPLGASPSSAKNRSSNLMDESLNGPNLEVVEFDHNERQRILHEHQLMHEQAVLQHQNMNPLHHHYHHELLPQMQDPMAPNGSAMDLPSLPHLGNNQNRKTWFVDGSTENNNTSSSPFHSQDQHHHPIQSTSSSSNLHPPAFPRRGGEFMNIPWHDPSPSSGTRNLRSSRSASTLNMSRHHPNKSMSQTQLQSHHQHHPVTSSSTSNNFHPNVSATGRPQTTTNRSKGIRLDITLDENSVPNASGGDASAGSTSSPHLHHSLSKEGNRGRSISPRPTTPGVGFVIGKDISIMDPTSEMSMAKKKELIMQQSLKRKEEQEAKRIAIQESMARRREEEMRKTEESERKKEEDRIRKQKILEEYRLKKLADEDDQKNGPLCRVSSATVVLNRPKREVNRPMSASNSGLNHKARPKSLHVSSSHMADFLPLNPKPTKVSVDQPDHASSSSSHLVGKSPLNASSVLNLSTIGGNPMNSTGSSRPQSALSSSSRLLSSPPSSGLPTMPTLFQKQHRGPPSDTASDVGSNFSEYTGPKLFVKPTGKSNKGIILNAINIVLAGSVNSDLKKKVIEEIGKSESKHFLILFRGAGLQFRSVFSYCPDRDQVIKLHGPGPKVVTNEMIDKFYKYNSGSKNFTHVHTKHLSITIDGFTIHNHLWPSRRPVSIIVTK